MIGYVTQSATETDRLLIGKLLKQGAVRGMHAYGIAALIGTDGMVVAKHSDVDEMARVAASLVRCGESLRMVAHCRYSTSGDHACMDNNQPIVAGDLALVFNGVISMRSKPEYEAEFGVTCRVDNDGEIFARRLIAGETAERFLERVPCSFAGLWLRGGKLYAIRNSERPLWRSGGWFVSTADIWKRAGGASELTEVEPGGLVGPL